MAHLIIISPLSRFGVAPSALPLNIAPRSALYLANYSKPGDFGMYSVRSASTKYSINCTVLYHCLHLPIKQVEQRMRVFSQSSFIYCTVYRTVQYPVIILQPRPNKFAVIPPITAHCTSSLVGFYSTPYINSPAHVFNNNKASHPTNNTPRSC
jgi:hypothetical protein